MNYLKRISLLCFAANIAVIYHLRKWVGLALYRQGGFMVIILFLWGGIFNKCFFPSLFHFFFFQKCRFPSFFKSSTTDTIGITFVGTFKHHACIWLCAYPLKARTAIHSFTLIATACCRSSGTLFAFHTCHGRKNTLTTIHWKKNHT